MSFRFVSLQGEWVGFFKERNLPSRRIVNVELIKKMFKISKHVERLSLRCSLSVSSRDFLILLDINILVYVTQSIDRKFKYN